MRPYIAITVILCAAVAHAQQGGMSAHEKYQFSKYCFEQNQIDLGIDYIQQAAHEGLDSAQYDLGLIYETYQVADSAYQYIHQASKTHDDALMRLAHYYQIGFGCPANPNKAFEITQQLANKNHGEALHTMASYYYQGEYVPQSKEQGSLYWHRAADAGYLDAQIGLAQYYYVGGDEWGIKKDKIKARHYASLASKQEDPRGKTLMGNFCEKEGEMDEAIKWWKIASDEGDPSAQYSYGRMLITGEGGVTQNAQQAIPLLQSAADNNVVDAIQLLGSLYFEGIGVTKDINKGLKLLEQAANNNNVTAQRLLGEYYLQGREVPQDIELGVYWLEKAVNGGNGEAANTLGLLYTKSDVQKAFEYFQKGHDLGNIISTYNLGLAYADGKGVGQDNAKAFELLKLAADNGFFGGQALLASIYARGIGRKADYAQAVKWAQKTINNERAKKYQGYESNFYDCYYILDYCYRYGLGVTRNVKKANQYKVQADKLKKFASGEIDWEKVLTTFDEQKNQEIIDEYNQQLGKSSDSSQ